jgi:multiple sugar transport system permease protein
MKRKSEKLAAALYLLPSGMGFLIFVLLPVIACIALSFFRWNIFHSPRFVGFENYKMLLGFGYIGGYDEDFWTCLGNTLFFMLAIPLNMFISLCLAMLINRGLKGADFFKTIFILPTICSGIGLMFLWKYIYSSGGDGFLGEIAANLGIPHSNLLESYSWSKPAIMLMNTWMTVGGINMLIYLAGLQNIPQDIYEAAELEGADWFEKLTRITFPLLTPTNYFILTTSIITSFEGGFNAAYIMTNGGPDGSTATICFYIFRHAFQWFNIGYACAIATVLFLIVMAFACTNWKMGKAGKIDYVI